MSFQFRLQKVLDLKTKEKEQAEWDVAQAVQEKSIQEETVSRWESERDLVQSEISKATQSAISVADLQHLDIYISHVNHVLYDEIEQLNRVEEKLEHSRETLKVKYIEVKSWDQMRNKAYSHYQFEQSRIEQSQLEETAITRFMRNASK